MQAKPKKTAAIKHRRSTVWKWYENSLKNEAYAIESIGAFVVEMHFVWSKDYDNS